MAHPYSLYMLPVVDMGLIAQTADEAQQKLTSTLNIVDGIKATPAGLPAALGQAIANIRYHVIVGLAFIDAFLRTGHNSAEPMVSVEGLQNAIDLQIAEINKTRPLWDQWYKDAVAQGTPAAQLPPPPPVAVTIPADVPASAIPSALAPMVLRDYVFVGVVAVGAWLLWRMFK